MGRPLLISVLAAVLALGALAGCNRDQATRTQDGRVSVYVVKKLMPVGMLVGSAKTNGTLEPASVPADVAGSEGLTDLTGIECLVAGQNLPAGTVARRSLFVEPSTLGLTGGLTGGTGDRPSGC